MKAVQQVQGVAAPLMREHIDTDVIIPSRLITSPSRAGLGAGLFAPWRYRPALPASASTTAPEEDPGFILNRPPWRQARILLAGRNFGCGSSREMAVWALQEWGIGCIVAPSFGAIFRDNAVRNGLLPVVLPEAEVAALAASAGTAEAPLVLCVDLQALQLRGPGGLCLPFAFDPDEREGLLSGLDAIERTWQHRAAIEAFEQRHRDQHPWLW